MVLAGAHQYKMENEYGQDETRARRNSYSQLNPFIVYRLVMATSGTHTMQYRLGDGPGEMIKDCFEHDWGGGKRGT